ncbi:MAG TPA: transcription antitermination factor NusB [Hyphomicrobium sp.]|nr:transcription antitermination factor NusB [Hyphomicrobium sp.]
MSKDPSSTAPQNLKPKKSGPLRERPRRGKDLKWQTAPLRAPDGMQARDVAVSALFSVFVEKRAFEDVFNKAAATRDLEPRDRAFARLIAASVLRHHGSLRAVIQRFIEKPLPEHQGRLEQILLSAAAQLLILDTPPHAAISLAVDQCRADSSAKRFDKLTNAVLRRVSEQGRDILATLDPVALNIPAWLLARWQATFGADTAHAIALASLREAPLDLTVRADAAGWASHLGGLALPTGSVRLAGAGRIEELPGYDDGAWWVQDAAAALPAKLLGDIAGKDVADLCAAPGGKTAQLAAAGARVTAIDKSPGRLNRLRENLTRLGLDAETAVADAADFAPGRQFDAILIDAPCTATGTIRRHPDILILKRDDDIAALALLQRRILEAAAVAVKPGGTVVYCTCSLEPAEGADQIDAFLAANPQFSRAPIDAAELGIDLAWLTEAGDLRTLPSHLPDLPEGMTGLDGFFAAKLVRGA